LAVVIAMVVLAVTVAMVMVTLVVGFLALKWEQPQLMIKTKLTKFSFLENQQSLKFLSKVSMNKNFLTLHHKISFTSEEKVLLEKVKFLQIS
jgi:hypothetical protein